MVDIISRPSIIVSVDSISRDGSDMPIYIIHYKKPKAQHRYSCMFSKLQKRDFWLRLLSGNTKNESKSYHRSLNQMVLKLSIWGSFRHRCSTCISTLSQRFILVLV